MAKTKAPEEVLAPTEEVLAPTEEVIQELNLKLAVEQAIKCAKGQTLETQIVQRLEEVKQFII